MDFTYCLMAWQNQHQWPFVHYTWSWSVLSFWRSQIKLEVRVTKSTILLNRSIVKGSHKLHFQDCANYWSHQYSKNLNKTVQKITNTHKQRKIESWYLPEWWGGGRQFSTNVIHDHHGNTFYPQFMWMKFHVLLLWTLVDPVW
jgi:hypothetical protein